MRALRGKSRLNDFLALPLDEGHSRHHIGVRADQHRYIISAAAGKPNQVGHQQRIDPLLDGRHNWMTAPLMRAMGDRLIADRTFLVLLWPCQNGKQ